MVTECDYRKYSLLCGVIVLNEYCSLFNDTQPLHIDSFVSNHHIFKTGKSVTSSVVLSASSRPVDNCRGYRVVGLCE